MSPLQLLAGLLLAAAVAAAPLATREATRSGVCRLIQGESDNSFERFSLEGTTECRCQSDSAAECQPLRPYPTVAPGSADAQLSQFHQPQVSSTALQALLSYQIQFQCRTFSQRGRRCVLTWPADGRAAPVCDCAKSDGVVSIKMPYFIDKVSSRRVPDDDGDNILDH